MYLLKYLPNFAVDLRLWTSSQIIYSHPESDVLVAVLLPQIVGELLQTWNKLSACQLPFKKDCKHVKALIAVEEWDNLGQQCLDELVDSMPRRIQACINARGRATGY